MDLVDKMNAAPRCGATAKRTGKPCQAPAMKGQERCYYHGGAAGSGAPEGNSNAVKHGRYAEETLDEEALLEELWEILG